MPSAYPDAVARSIRVAHVPAAALAVAVLLSGCDPVGTGPVDPPGNVDYLLNAQVVTTDTAVVVDGRTIIRFPYNGRALYLERFPGFRYHGWPEHDYPQSVLRADAWWLILRHERPPEERGDSIIRSFVDHGEVTIAGVGADKRTDPPHFSAHLPWRYENYVSYFSRAFTMAEWDSGWVTADSAAYFGALRAGEPLTVQTTGSDDVGPITATFAARAFAELVGMENTGEIPIDGAMPEVDVNRPWTLRFNRPLDPAHAYMVLIPFRGGGPRPFVQPNAPSHEVVLPTELLRQMVQGAPDELVPMTLIINEWHLGEHQFEGELSDGTPFSLPTYQWSQTAMYLNFRK